ncbi:MAG TPA: ABC transporter permease [Baekduia sp.]
MTAVALRLRAELRIRWRAWLALAVVCGIAAGTTVALAAAASRTETALGRYLRATSSADAYANAGIGFDDATLDVGHFEHLPQVARSERTLLVALLSRSRGGRPIVPVGAGSIQYQVPSDDRPRNTIDVPLMLRGRLPDPDRADEVLADPKALDTLGIGLGDAFTVRLVSGAFLTRHVNDMDVAADPRSPGTAAWGPLVTVRVVGVRAHAKADVDGGYVDFTPAFRRAHGGAAGVGHWAEELAVRLHGGSRAVPAFRAAVDAAAAGHSHGFYDPATSRPVVQRTMDLIAQALRLLAIAAGTAALVLGGQALLRTAAFDARPTRTLRALGMTTGQLTGLAAARGALMAAPAVVATAIVAVALSAGAPVGWARQIDPDRGLRFDAVPIAIGCATVTVALVGAGALTGWRAARARPGRGTRPSPRSAAFATALARSRLSVAAVTGVRMALGRRAPTATVPVQTTLASAVAAVTVVVVALTVGKSVTHLLDTPRLYGQTWDYETYNGGRNPALERAAMRDPAVQDVALGFSGPLRVGDRVVGARATADLKGRLDPEVIEGRAPRADDEALLATKTLAALHVRIGDRVAVRSGRRAARLRVVGRGVLPSDKWTELGHGLFLGLPALKRIAPEAPAAAVYIRLRPGTDRAAAFARLDRLYTRPVQVRPQEISDLARVDGAPALVGVVFVLAAAAALAHLLASSVQRRRRDLAILKTLGFTRAQVRSTVAWQATTVAAAGVLVGVPLGLALGRLGWNLFADGLGIVSEPALPVWSAALAVPAAAILLANVVAALPARRAAATRPAAVLRAE